MSTMKCRALLLFMFLGQLDALRVKQPGYTGYDWLFGWEYPKTNLKHWTPEIVKMWFEHHQKDVDDMYDAAAKKACNTVMLGDSITELFVRGSFNSGQKNPDKLLLQEDVQVFALGGDRYRDLGWRLFQGGGMKAIQKCDPKQVFMMMGRNDLSSFYESHSASFAQSELHLDMHNLISQLREALPNSRLILHTVLPMRCAGNARTCKVDDDLREVMTGELLTEAKNMSLAHGMAETVYADCSESVQDDALNNPNYLDRVHLNPSGLEKFGLCLQKKYHVEVMADVARHSTLPSGKSDVINLHEERPTLIREPRNMKLLLLIGDSIDRYMVDDWCEHFKTSGSELHFGQADKGRFGKWSEMGKRDSKFENLLNSSGVDSWKSWSSRICIIPERGLAAAFVFNPKGVNPQGPWWNQDIMESQYDMKFCANKLKDGDVEQKMESWGGNQCPSFQNYLGPAVKAITTYLDVEPRATIIASNFWDVDRLKSYQKSLKDFYEPGFQAEWKQNATNLMKAVTEIVPHSKIVWHTAPLGNPIPDHDGGSIFVLQGGPDSHTAITAINKAAREFAQEKGLPVEEMAVIKEYRVEGHETKGGLVDSKVNGIHPTPKTLVEFAEHLFKTHAP